MRTFKLGDFTDYYAILGVDSLATTDEIRKAYRQKSKNCHPDVLINIKGLTDEEAEQATMMFYQLTEACEVLTDPKRKEKFDKAYKMYRDLKSKYGTEFEYDVQDKKIVMDYLTNSNMDVDDLEVMIRVVNDYTQEQQRKRDEYYHSADYKFEDDLEFGREEERKKRKEDRKERHAKQKEEYELENGNRVFTVGDLIGYQVGKIKMFILGDIKSAYHVNREKSKANNGNKIKPMTIAVATLVLAGGITAGVAMKHNHDTQEAVKEKVGMQNPAVDVSTEKSTPSPEETLGMIFEEEKEEVVLKCVYEVGPNDTLSEIAEKTGQSMESIKRNNPTQFAAEGIYAEQVNYGELLNVEYHVNKEDLPSLTTTITITGRDGIEIARENRISFSTLQMLNPNVKFEYTAGKQIVPSSVDTLVVLDFEKLDEYRENLNNGLTSSR